MDLGDDLIYWSFQGSTLNTSVAFLAGAPVLTSATAAAVGSDSYSGTVSTDKATGTLYHVVTQSSTEPSKAQVKAGNDDTGSTADASGSQSVTSSGTQSVSGSGLTTGTTYFIHYMHEDSGGNQADVVSSGSFVPAAVMGKISQALSRRVSRSISR